MNAEEKLPKPLDPDILSQAYSARESWRVFEIMAEFVESTERLSSIRPAVSIFGSARTPPDHPYYQLTEQIARKLSDAGFSVISGGGPGIMEAANKGAFFGNFSQRRPQYPACRTSSIPIPIRTSARLSAIFLRAR